MIAKAVILTAGMGTRLRNITNDEIPKPFLKINNKPLIERSVEKLIDSGIKEIILVTGHLDHFFEKLKNKYPGIKTVKNEKYEVTGSMASFYCSRDLIGDDDILLLEGDLIYEKRALDILLSLEEKDAILLSEDKKMSDDYYVELSSKNNINRITNDLSEINGNFGEWTGLQKVSNDLCKAMFKKFETENNKKLGYEYCFEKVAKDRLVYCKKEEGILWSEIDDEYQLNGVIKKLYSKLLEKGEGKYE
ncbi:MAG: phosphocholine cytidylyltransferase family protein [Fusobacterium sp.]|uniref:phosphocholine cytidylyltransferase family protein n=1 Tax=Fusobacterium sp. TaxID=68766 RepID=UPI002A758046|nr:phosphocholine cytidylyltransferase family protein [Fusobacterium sp.]MDY2981715.1 phosphocholine cytidylyltransferase family protein [Fusobacterium sp.]